MKRLMCAVVAFSGLMVAGMPRPRHRGPEMPALSIIITSISTTIPTACRLCGIMLRRSFIRLRQSTGRSRSALRRWFTTHILCRSITSRFTVAISAFNSVGER